MALKFVALLVITYSLCGQIDDVLSLKSQACPPYPQVDGGFVNYGPGDDVYNVGAMATLGCNAQHHPVGNTITRCTANGTWKPALGYCQFVKAASNLTYCSPMINPHIATVRFSPRMKAQFLAPGAKAYLECPPGQFAAGSKVAECVDGKWNPSRLGECRRK